MSVPFDQFLRSIGLRPRVIAADEEVRRCPTDRHPRKKNGAYWLAADGKFGWGRDHAIHIDGPVKWHAEKEDPGMSRAELDRLRRKNERLRKRRERKLQQEKAEASEKAREFYRSCKPLRDSHPYLEAHRLSIAGCEGLKEDPDGWLVVPAFRPTPDGSREVVTVQRISPDGKKLFWKHAPAAGATYTIPRRDAAITVLCEGLATGLALYDALHPAPSARILVAFTATNLYHRDVVKRVPEGSVVVAADNDEETEERTGENPGVIAANRAAVLLGCGVAIPRCVDGTDWADYREERFLYHKDRLHAFGRDYMAWQKADADMRRRVIPHASMNQIPALVS